MKTYRFAGVSTVKGVCKVRFANDAGRVKMLAKDGQTDIDLVELPSAMTKEDAIRFLIGIDFDDGNATVRETLESAAQRRGVEIDQAEDVPAELEDVPA